jgi:hypothetical protein
VSNFQPPTADDGITDTVCCAVDRFTVYFDPVIPKLAALVLVFKSGFRDQQFTRTEVIKPETTPALLSPEHQLNPVPGFLPASRG